jgi:PPOX class probable F420-dependent enzyme
MMPIPASAKQLLETDALAHLTTINEDGSPHVTVAWAGLDGEEIVFGTLFDQRKLQNIRRDPRVVVAIEGTQIVPPGLKEYIVIEGKARVTEGGAAELLQELAATYLGPATEFPPMPDPPPGFVTHVAVERVRGVGPWAEGR